MKTDRDRWLATYRRQYRTGNRRNLVIALHSYMSDDATCSPGVSALADSTGLRPAYVRHLLQGFERRRVIERVEHGTAHGSAAVYRGVITASAPTEVRATNEVYEVSATTDTIGMQSATS
jgi:hypothetical protein